MMKMMNLFLILLLTGFVPLVQLVPHKYHLIQQNKSWTDTQTYCRANYDDLATIENAADMALLQAEAQKQQFSSSAWVGLYKDFYNLHWSLGNELLGSWTNWASAYGEPQSDGTEECLAIDGLGWWDAVCMKAKPFICFDDRRTGTDRYIYYSDIKTWDDAQTFCRVNHTDLASARNSLEYSDVRAANLQGSLIWIGLHRNSWKWSDQTNISTIPWAPGQPDNVGKKEFCGFLENGLASDELCSNLKPFFCYSVITGQQQIIRMNVQSDQDVNDPALTSAILEQILQKLKDHGMENIRVKFKKQPNGSVFHKQEGNRTTV